jgi:Mg-chelatase subunit ChlD
MITSTSSGVTISDDGGNQGDASCTATEVQASPVPLDIVIMLDRSASMMDNNKWTGTVAALDTFFAASSSAGIGVGLGVFPVGSSCNKTMYQNLLVPIGALPQSQTALTTAIAGQMPLGDTTPLQAAIEGGLYAAAQQKAAHPDHVVVVVLATDGTATCVTLDPTPAQSAADGLTTNGIMTFTVAMQGSDTTTLNAVAQAGGTGHVFDVTTDITLWSQALEQIRAKSLPCDVVIPPPPPGQQLDTGLVNVVYTPGGGAATTIPYAMSSANCGSNAGWYYDDAANPTKVLFCPATCTVIKADANAKVDVAFGCKTITK